jgi:23S rRNA pseudouridine955/2504/2580 synthase
MAIALPTHGVANPRATISNQGVMAVETKLVREDEDGMRLDRWFKTHFPNLSFGHLQKLLRSGQVRLEGGRVKGDTRLADGQNVRIPPMQTVEMPVFGKTGKSASAKDMSHPNAPASTARTLKAFSRQETDEKALLRSMILYEDESVMVLNKPAGLASQGGPGITRSVDSLLDSMRDRDGQKPRLVHRLDKETSGCLIVAKTRLAAATLAKSFRSRSARKVYWALVVHVPRVKQGRISTFLAKGQGDGIEKMRVAKHGDKDADHAVTYYAVVETAAQQLAWLSLKPVTGRTHQLRAHTAHIGHPIIGDDKYFDIENWQLPGGIQKRLHLLARRLVIPHPKTGKLIDVTAPLPPHMQQSWNLLGFDTKNYDPIEEAPEE